MEKDHVVKSGLKLKKGDIFKKKKKTSDIKQIDMTIKRNETTKTTTTKTSAELKFEQRKLANMTEKMLKKAAVSHREKVERFNQQMSELTEFNDIPKVSWTK
ncbi:unnamed protein product [Caenorhabditis auriculariae]|uniref:Protein FAM32A n=1 Tax=Caenorhabditis auriculariae TaxID=2777116 RepID=A0A8S1H0W0_9PELO|nr:unnamed protein product [Caenorhabditis auriculariae]